MNIGSILGAIATKLEAFAAKAVKDAEDEFIKVEGEVKEDFMNGGGLTKAVSDIENGLIELVDKWGQDAVDLVTALVNDDSLSGLEKANLAATQLVEKAALQGITLAAQDVTSLIKNAYIAVIGALAKL